LRKKEEHYAQKNAAKTNKNAALQKVKDEKKAAEAAAKQAIADKAEARKQFEIAYKKSLKLLKDACAATLAGSNYDRFWVEAKQRSWFNTKELCAEGADKLNEINADANLDQAGKISTFEAWL